MLRILESASISPPDHPNPPDPELKAEIVKKWKERGLSYPPLILMRDFLLLSLFKGLAQTAAYIHSAYTPLLPVLHFRLHLKGMIDFIAAAIEINSSGLSMA